MPSSQADRITFDLDDTLYPERDFAFSGFDAVGRFIEQRHGIIGFAGICKRLFDGPDRARILDVALSEVGLTHDQPLPDLIELYRGHEPRIALCPDAARYLAGGGPFALITDGPEATQRAKIAALGLDAYFDQIIPTGQWPDGFGKPHPRAYEQVAEAAGGGVVSMSATMARRIS